MSNFTPINFNEPMNSEIANSLLEMKEESTLPQDEYLAVTEEEKKCHNCGAFILPGMKNGPYRRYSLNSDLSPPYVCRACYDYKKKHNNNPDMGYNTVVQNKRERTLISNMDSGICSTCNRTIYKQANGKIELFYSIKHNRSSPLVCRRCIEHEGRQTLQKKPILTDIVEKELQNRVTTASIEELLTIRDKSQQTQEKNRTNDMIDECQRIVDTLNNHNCGNPECHIKQVLTKFFNDGDIEK